MEYDEARAVAENLAALMEAAGYRQKQLAAKSGLSQRSISNLLRPDRGHSPTLESVSKVAAAFGLKAWQMMIPGQDVAALKPNRVDKLLENYIQSDEAGRQHIERASETEAAYRLTSQPLKAGNR